MRFLKKLSLLFLILFLSGLHAQVSQSSASLEELYRSANSNYPLIKDATLIDKIEEVGLAVISKNALPKLTLEGRGQIQSENIELNLGTTSIQAPLETWNTSLNIDYNLYDGGNTKAQKNIETASANVDRNSLEVQLRSLKDQVNTLLFAILLSRKQKLIFENSKEDLESNIRTLQAAYENGTALESEVSKLKVRQLELVSEIVAVEGDMATYFLLLEQLTGKTLPRDVQFKIPGLLELDTNTVNRPENLLYDSQKTLFAAQEASVAASTLPKISLFAQGGVGNPNQLNFSDLNTAAYALGGVKLNWNFIDFGKGKKERKRLQLQQEQVEVERELFLFDIESKSKEYQERIKATQQQIVNDTEIVDLQKNILAQTKVQLDNGVINATDYVTQLNATLNSEQELEFNKIQLQQLQIEYLTLLGQL
ncbi:TolC family protein [Flagellimonas meridianipacifica]|uniref:Outer membrane protein TolC n=1 Tax=Flagellimonas meridianipacifica TaxID=1080225 RepID=A0A2T0MAQ2_9FLAO|nr:TolC family protein [Allomuricauda pacifica]PRX54578.1 outer membrane protein TolC [Allomuricauda pacifica]